MPPPQSAAVMQPLGTPASMPVDPEPEPASSEPEPTSPGIS
jgi:hypothetical protein